MSLRTSGKRAFVTSAFALFAGVTGLAGVTCKPSADQGSVEILTVDDPFAGPPAATQLTVQGIDWNDGGPDGAVTTLARAPLDTTEGSQIDLGTYDEAATDYIQVTATDSAGTTVARGETLAVELGAISGVTLGVFVQRTGMLSRMPDPLSDGRPAPLVSVLGGRYIFVAGGTDTSVNEETNIYDLIAWSPLESPPVLPFAPESMAFVDLEALAINSTGATWYDLTGTDTGDAGAPSGTAAQWAAVAGGQTIVSSDYSTSWVVGGTRACSAGVSPSNTVLIVASTGTLTWKTLSVERCGATAAYVDGLGMVVEGGNVAASTAQTTVPGVESMDPDGNPLSFDDYAADLTSGAGMVPLGPAGTTSSSNVLVVGGATNSANGAIEGGTQARVITLPCGTNAGWAPCSTTTWQATIPTSLTFAQAFAIDPATAFVLGDDAAGVSHAYRLTSATIAEIPFRVTRSHARAVSLPLNNAIAVVGGDPNIESFIP